ncbi:GntR family transcriptional regulator [Roseateles chitosanitabidus]|jgi:DNA-binding GntR family transcriptional regulator|uniref:GntR family transcriptional regulator n=1 Tax=Roseateles chitosanitabidus TaxID=65048 RepID=UPI00082A8B15|nr:GntR family transcriptional regulator [Roseateles chitosanitabidus]MBO9689978.1 GntR family transcriptional regulator [Roseateles chitosanitabidus]
MVRSHHPINAPTYLRLRDQIRTDIEEGNWRLGQHLTLNELSVHYRVSNVPVREALLQLQGDGLVDMRMNKGAVVLNVDERFIDKYFDVREALQSLLVTQACRARLDAGDAPPVDTTAGLTRGLDLLAQVEDAARRGVVRDLLAADQALHEQLGALGGNDHAELMLAARGRLLEAFRRMRVDLLAPELMVLPLHDGALLRAVADGDEAAAREAVRLHVAAMRAYMKKLLRIPAGRLRPDGGIVGGVSGPGA